MLRLLLALLVALGALAYYKGIGIDQARAWFSGGTNSASANSAQKIYRWKDAAGNLNYGAEPPPGVKAEPVKNMGTVSVVPATKIPEVKKPDPTEGKSIQQLATERAIDNATK